MEPNSPSPTIADVPAFQFYADLPPALMRHEILTVTDARTVLSHDRENGKSYIQNGEKTEGIDSGVFVSSITDSGLALVEDKAGRRRVVNLRSKAPVRLVHSPVFEPTLTSISEAGLIGGFVVRKGNDAKKYARIWNCDGSEMLGISDADSRIEFLEPFGSTWSAGSVGSVPVLWSKNERRALRSMGETKITGINGSGMVSGQTDEKAVVWNSDGSISYLGSELLGPSRTLAILEDSSFVVEIEGGEKSYRLGRGNYTVPFESKSIKSVEGFPLVSVDAISPSGVMVATIMEPTSRQKTRVLIGPETYRSDTLVG